MLQSILLMSLFDDGIIGLRIRDKAVPLLRLVWSSRMNLGSNFTYNTLKRRLRLSSINLHNNAQLENMYGS